MPPPTGGPEIVPQLLDAEEQAGIGEAMSAGEEAFERWRKRSGAVLAPLAFLAVRFLAPAAEPAAKAATGHAPGLTPQGRTLSAILACVATLWITETLPLPVTALLGAMLCILLGVADAKAVLDPFADKIVFLFIGSFMLARAMSLHGLDRRIALSFLSIRWVAAHPARVLAGMGAITALLSMWVSNTATTAMMVPIAIGVLGALHQVRVANGLARGPLDARSWPFATAMLLMIAYAASIGGIGTPVGSPPNLIGIGQLQKIGVKISFFRWMALMVPMLAVMAAALFALLYWLHPSKPITRDDAGADAGADARQPTADESRAAHATGIAEYLATERRALGPWTAGQLNTALAFGVAVALWILPGFLIAGLGPAHRVNKFFEARLPESMVALLAALLLFVLPTKLSEGRFTLDWPQAVRIDWGTILLFGGGLSLGSLMFSTGVAQVLGDKVTSMTGVSSLWALTACAIVMGIILSETTSNTTATTMVVPVIIAAAHSAGVSPVPPALGAVLGASYGFMLPVSTPPNAIVYGSGLVPIPRMIRAGFLFDLIGFFVILLGLRLLCPLLGLM